MISSLDRVKAFVAAGNTNPVSLNFPFAAATDLKVTARDGDAAPVELTLNSDYSIGGSAAQWRAGLGTIVPIDIEAGLAVRVERFTALGQTYDPQPGVALDHRALAASLDNAVMRAIDSAAMIGEVRDRSWLLPEDEIGGVLPSASVRAGKFRGWDGAGQEVALSGTGTDDAFRTDFADPDVGMRLGVWNPGTPQSVNTTAFDKMADFATARERGAGPLASTAKNMSVFTELFGTPLRGRIFLDPVTYDIGANSLTFGLSNVWVRGIRGKTKITTTNLGLLWFAACHDVIFEDIIFEVSATDAGTADYRGVLNLMHAVFERITFHRCIWTVPDAGLNGVKIIVEPEALHAPGQEGYAESIHFYECEVRGAGRMGVEVQNHGHTIDTIKRYADIVWEGGVIQDTGLVDAVDGQGISFSGYGSDCRVDTTFDNNSFANIEGVGISSSKFSGRVRNQLARAADPLSFTNTLPMRDLTIADFKTIGQANGSALLRSIVGLAMRGNVLDLSGYVDVTNLEKLRSTDDHYKTRHPLGIYINGGDAKDNAWYRLFLDRSATPPGSYSGMRFDNTATGNLFEGLTYIAAGDGVLADNNGGAFNNWIKGRRSSLGVLADAAMVSVHQAFTGDANVADAELYAMQRYEADFIEITSTGALTATRTLTLPKNVPGLKRFKNSTAGGQSITIAKPGGGSTVTIATGVTATIAVTTGGVVSA